MYMQRPAAILGILWYHFLPFSLEIGSLTEREIRLAISKPQLSCLS